MVGRGPLQHNARWVGKEYGLGLTTLRPPATNTKQLWLFHDGGCQRPD